MEMSSMEYSAQDVKRVLDYIGIKVPKQTDPKGNVKISSPLREDKNPSFSINLKKDGTWIDFGTNERGNLDGLVGEYYKVNANKAYSFIQDILANKFPKVSDYDFKGRKEQSSEDIPVVLRSKRRQKNDVLKPKESNKHEKKQASKSEQPMRFNVEKSKTRLEKEDHPLLETLESYDLINKDTLQLFNCGIHMHNQSDWLSIPYETGVQLYRREKGEKVIRMVKGSQPKDAWFGVDQLEKKGTLIISKSPREAMLIKQEFGDLVDAISITTGETETLSASQTVALKTIIGPYNIVKVIFDCDNDSAQQITRDFTELIQKLFGKQAVVRYINIHELTDGGCKDVTDLFKQHDRDWVLENVLTKGSTLSGKSKVNISELISKDISVDDAPRFPGEIYDKLPTALRNMTGLLEEVHQRDVFLTSALPVIAAHMPKVKIPHNDGAYSPDYFSILIANPGSGKGVADKAKKLGETLNAHLVHESEKEQAEWDQLPKEEKEFKSRPKSRKLFMPGNSSSRAVYEALAFNNGRGLIFETEIDSLVNASNQEWGDYSDLLRKTFHHESISLSRKEYDLNVSDPELSIFMSGTFDQFRTMFPSAENGYYSRFAFYTFKAPIKWHSHRPSKRSMALDEQIRQNSERLFHIYRHLKKRDKPLMVYLEEHHWDELDETFAQNMLQIKEDDLSEYLQSSNKRLAVIAIRIAALVAVLRMYEKEKSEALNQSSITLTNEDFRVGHLMANTHYSHTIRLYHQIPNAKAIKSKGKRLMQFYSLLPESFQKKEANFVGKHLKITVRSVTNYLKKLLEEGLVTKEQHGIYSKTT